MTLNQFREALSKEGVEAIESVDFDPELHHAVEQAESAEHAEGAIIDQIRKGYKLKDKVIRPTLVKVAKNKEEENV